MLAGCTSARPAIAVWLSAKRRFADRGRCHQQIHSRPRSASSRGCPPRNMPSVSAADGTSQRRKGARKLGSGSIPSAGLIWTSCATLLRSWALRSGGLVAENSESKSSSRFTRHSRFSTGSRPRCLPEPFRKVWCLSLTNRERRVLQMSKLGHGIVRPGLPSRSLLPLRRCPNTLARHDARTTRKTKRLPFFIVS